jgi:uncharacterized membrane protein YccC
MTTQQNLPASTMHRAGGERISYIIRCVVAACLAYEAARLAGLSDTVWAPISALVVSQETHTATIGAVTGRCIGTLAGALVALLVSLGGNAVHLPLILQLALAVALSACLSIGRPHLRVATWTVAIVLFNAGVGQSTVMVATDRALDVILGAISGGLTAALAERLRARICRARPFGSRDAKPDFAGD